MKPDASEAYERVRVRLKARLADILESESEGHRSKEQRVVLEEHLHETLKRPIDNDGVPKLSNEEEHKLIQEVISDSVGYGPIDQLLGDPSVTEIMVNGPKEIFVERKGRLTLTDLKFRDMQHLMGAIERMLGSVNMSVNETEPLCDASLPDGSRINVIIPPLVLNGPVVTIRTKSQQWTMKDYVKIGALSEQAAEFLQLCVRARVNLIVSGGTSSGKTTLVSILSNDIPKDERIITIENVAELELSEREHWIRLVAKAPNVQGRGEIPLRVLVKNALRMRPDRMILGEARGGEALDVVQAMHSGHDGVMTVLHANTARAALERLETLMLMSGLDIAPSACRVQIASAVDLVVHLARYADGSRHISAITQVLGASQKGYELEDLFTFDAKGYSKEGVLQGTCHYTAAKPKFLSKFRLGNVTIPPWLTA